MYGLVPSSLRSPSPVVYGPLARDERDYDPHEGTPESFPSFLHAIEYAVDRDWDNREELQNHLISLLSDDNIIDFFQFGNLIYEAFGVNIDDIEME